MAPAAAPSPDFREVRGQATAGGHNALFISPPGSGKTLVCSAATLASPVPARSVSAITASSSSTDFPNSPKNVLELLRQPLEEGNVLISRAQATHNFPSRFTLVAAMNPCPCMYQLNTV